MNKDWSKIDCHLKKPSSKINLAVAASTSDSSMSEKAPRSDQSIDLLSHSKNDSICSIFL